MAHPATFLILSPFALVFVHAAHLEFRRWLRYGPSKNRRASFPIDTSAPSYEPPPEEKDPT